MSSGLTPPPPPLSLFFQENWPSSSNRLYQISSIPAHRCFLTCVCLLLSESKEHLSAWTCYLWPHILTCSFFKKSFWNFKNLFNCNWRRVALQSCVGLCRTSPWISHQCTCGPSLLNLPPASLPIPPLWVATEPRVELPPSQQQIPLAVLHMML